MRMILWIGLALFSSIALAENMAGKLICYPHAMVKPGLLEGVTIAGAAGDSQVTPTLSGPTIQVDLAEASEAKTTYLDKIITGNFDGEITFHLSFIYKGQIAPGNLTGSKVALEHRGKKWNGSYETYAKTIVETPLVAGKTTHIEMFSTNGNLILFQVECTYTP